MLRPLEQLRDAGIEAKVENDDVSFAFPDFDTAWNLLSGVTAAALTPVRTEEAKTAVRGLMARSRGSKHADEQDTLHRGPQTPTASFRRARIPRQSHAITAAGSPCRSAANETISGRASLPGDSLPTSAQVPSDIAAW